MMHDPATPHPTMPSGPSAVARAGVVFVAWTFVALVVTGQAYVGLLANPRPELAIERIFIAELLAWYFWALATPLIWWLGRRYPLDRARWKGSLAVHALSAAFLVTLHTALVVPIIFTFDLLFPEPGTMELFLFRASVRFHVGVLVYAGIVIVGHALDRSAQLRERDVRVAQVETTLVEARLAALRSQLRPHFLFNTLNTVAMLIRERASDRALHVVVHLSDLLRSILKSDDAAVPLRQELALLESYVAIEAARYEDRLQVSYDITDSSLAALVPALLLQPLVENAIRHSTAADGESIHVEVRGSVAGDVLSLRVLDNGPGVPAGWSIGDGDGIGMRNVRDRMEMLYGHHHHFAIHARNEGGTEVTLQIPLTMSRDAEHHQSTDALPSTAQGA